MAVPEGDISAAYSAETFPKIKVFLHEGGLFTNCGGHSSGPVAAAADCYPVIPTSEYSGPGPRRYTYEGREAYYRSQVFNLGRKVMFVANDASVDEWRQLFRAMYAEGGWFARHANYGLFLNEDSRIPISDHARAALGLELAGDSISHSKAAMQRLLDDNDALQFSEIRQLDLSL